MHLDHAELFSVQHASIVDASRLQCEGDWGIFHELGHNQQEGSWTFEGTVEVTCNLFTLFSMQKLCGIEPWDHVWLQPFKPKAKEYLKCPNFSSWQGDPGIALVSYVLIQRAFGWDCISSTLISCSACVENNASQGDKIDAWVKCVSRCCGRNLIPYYQAWGFPISHLLLTASEISSLPPWENALQPLLDFDDKV